MALYSPLYSPQADLHHYHEKVSRNAPIATLKVKYRDLSGDQLHQQRMFVDEIKNNLFKAKLMRRFH